MNGYQIKRILEAQEDRNQHKLTDWEADFIDDLSKKDDDYRLSEKQNEILNRISQKMV